MELIKKILKFIILGWIILLCVRTVTIGRISEDMSFLVTIISPFILIPIINYIIANQEKVKSFLIGSLFFILIGLYLYFATNNSNSNNHTECSWFGSKIWIDEYEKDDGTIVNGYYRKRPSCW